MRQPKRYINGNEEKRGDMLRAKELLIQAGLYRTMGNFGPYFPNKESRHHKKLQTFIIEDIEFTIIESEVMSFSFGSMEMSKPYIQKEAWFQTIKTC
jgi:hypothetical protein